MTELQCGHDHVLRVQVQAYLLRWHAIPWRNLGRQKMWWENGSSKSFSPALLSPRKYDPNEI